LFFLGVSLDSAMLNVEWWGYIEGVNFVSFDVY